MFADLEVRMVPRSLPVGGRRVMTSMTDSASGKDLTWYLDLDMLE